MKKVYLGRRSTMAAAQTLNPTQIHLLEMFSFCKDAEALQDLKAVLADYYAKKVQEEADALWDDGVLGADAIEQIGKEHWRTPYLKRPLYKFFLLYGKTFVRELTKQHLKPPLHQEVSESHYTSYPKAS